MMEINIKEMLTKVLTSISVALLMYIGHTVYNLDKRTSLEEYRMDTMNGVIQDIYETKLNEKDVGTLSQKINSKLLNLEGEIQKLRIELKNINNKVNIVSL